MEIAILFLLFMSWWSTQ